MVVVGDVRCWMFRKLKTIDRLASVLKQDLGREAGCSTEAIVQQLCPM